MFCNDKHKDKINNFADYLTFLLAGVYLFYQLQTITMFSFPFPGWFSKALIALMGITALLRIWAQGLKNRYVWIALLMAGVYGIVYHVGEFSEFLFIAILAICCIGIDYHKILKMYLFLSFILIGSAILASWGGVIKNLVYLEDGYVRSSWGLCYPTDFATAVLVLCMTIILCYNTLPGIVGIGLGFLAFFISVFVAKSSTGIICSTLLIIEVIYLEFIKYNTKKKRFLNALKVLVKYMTTAAFPLLGGLFFVCMYLYQHQLFVGYKLNNLFNHRISYAVNAYNTYGIKLFGVPFEQSGGGYSNFNNSSYFFVDSTFPLVLIRYGIVCFLMICIIWTWITYRANKAGNDRLALILALFAVHAFSEHHFMELHYNVFLILPFASFAIKDEREKLSDDYDNAVRSSGLKGNFKRGIPWIAAILLIAGTFLILPEITAYMRTLFDMLHWTAGDSSVKVFAVCACLLIIAVSMIWSIYNLLGKMLTRNKSIDAKVAGIPAILCLLILIIAVTGINTGTKYISSEEAELSKEEQAALKIISSSTKGHIYAKPMPILYEKSISQVRQSLYTGEDLARYRNTTVVMDAKTDYEVFIKTGFLYSQISKDHAIYTNDSSVIKAMMNEGYHLTGFYSYKKTLNLKTEAETNNLSYDSEKGMLINGEQNSMDQSASRGLYAGTYAFRYYLHREEASYDPDELICTLRVTASASDNTSIMKEVYGRDFDSKGSAEIELLATINDSSNTEFLASASGEQKVWIKKITYQMSPEYDVHSFYNKKRLRYRDEYYTLDGEYIQNAEGYAACTNRYDTSGNNIMIKYYNVDNKLVLNNGGYAVVKNVYNESNQLTMQKFYGTDNRPIVTVYGYASISFEYDSNGNIDSYKYYGIDGKKTENWAGYAELHRSYDDQSRVISETYYDTEGNITASNQGYASVEKTYDSYGAILKQTYYDIYGNIIAEN